MLKKFFSINLALALIFLVTTVFPPSLLSSETKDYRFDSSEDENWTDESLDYKPVIYKKPRCPRCGMEFYYVPGKESPHSHWVHYEAPKDKKDAKDDTKAKNLLLKDKMRDKASYSMFNDQKKIEEMQRLIDESARDKERDDAGFGLLDSPMKEYELRQKLTCPYDGHSFFAEGDVIEDKKMMRESMAISADASVIESSFSKSIPFGISKELKQFGYDLFVSQEEDRKAEDEEASSLSQASQALGALGMIGAAFNKSGADMPKLSRASAETAVVPVGPDYVVGPGDTLIINIWGSVQETFPADVDREGKIMLPKAGPLYLWGLKIKDAEERIKKTLNRHYTNFNMDLSMGKLRDIQVYVMGEVKRPGSYNMNSQATIFQALYEAGGLTKLGTLRKISLMHADGKKETIDLYPFLLKGEMIRPSRVQSGDTIFVQTVGDVVAIAGNVKRPAIYETKSEISLQDLLSFAGGITPTGDLQRLQVERIHNNEKRVMLDIELKRSDIGKFSMEDINMQNGDMVIVSPVVRLKHDFVSVIGNVERPGDYAFSKDMKVSGLIERAKGFLPGTYLYRAEIARVTANRTREIIPVNLNDMIMGSESEDLGLNEWDILLVYSESEVKPPSFSEIYGAVNRPGKYELTPGMKVSDLIFRAGGVRPGEAIGGAELFHIMPGEQPVVREVGVKRISEIDIAVDKDIILRAGDAVSIKSEPRLTQRRIVTLNGEVRYPGTYSIREGERLSSVIERAGGFTEDAFLDGTVFTRKSIRETQEKMRRHFIARENKALLEEQQSLLLRRGASSDSGKISESFQMRREMLEYIQVIDIEGRMVIKLAPLAQLKDTKYDILLEDGDALRVPQTPSAITVMGSVNNPASISFEPGKGIEYYIRKTGGLTKHADKAGIYVIKADGEALSKFMMSKSIMRGDTIVAPQEFKYWTPPGQLLRDTVEILARVAVGVGIIAALD
ncbi:MAG: SLBB domain-containing protein [Candidatus Omnitrophica bacterium]|nr:SLBB domain-containing protein [Candidatus Omnitrophota bacterium]